MLCTMKRTNFQERSYVTTRYDREQYRKGINIVASGNYQYLKDTQYETLPTVSKKKKKPCQHIVETQTAGKVT